MPGEAEKTAESLDLTLQEFFDQHLAVDWWEAGASTAGETLFVLAPRLEGESGGDLYPGDPTGRCSLLTQDGLCELHEHGKPFECKALTHDGHADHFQVALAWVPHQNQIRELLGFDPFPADYHGFESLLGGLFNRE